MIEAIELCANSSNTYVQTNLLYLIQNLNYQQNIHL